METVDRFDADGKVHDAERLKELQALPLDRKIQITIARIVEFVEAMGGPDKVYIAYSGGKDSTVLLHIARQIYPTIQAVFSDTGLEYPEVRQLARKNGAKLIRPEMMFTDVITKYGYPVVGKEVAEAIYYARRVVNAPLSGGGGLHRYTNARCSSEHAKDERFICGNIPGVRRRAEIQGAVSMFARTEP